MFHSKRGRKPKEGGRGRSLKKDDQINTSKTDGSVATGVFRLPTELISEILSRLPIESILRCQGVCKTWNSVIQNPLFINLQLAKSRKQPSRAILKPLYGGITGTTIRGFFLLDTEEHKIRQIENQNWRYSSLEIMSSCNGLLCIALDSLPGPVYISNPIIREFIILPSSEISVRLHRQHVGLGFDSSNGRYIVVRVYTEKKKLRVNKFEAIILGEKSWRSLNVPAIITECTIYGSVFWNGALHWKIRKESGRECMLSFEVRSENFAVTCFPGTGQVPDNFEIVELDGRLSFVQVCDTEMKLWRVTGDSTEGIRVRYEGMYCMNVKWNNSLNCEIIRGDIDEGYLLQVNAQRGAGGAWMRNLTQYFPKTEGFLPLHIPMIPTCFRTLAFRPTLLSPMQLHYVPRPCLK